MTWKNGVEPLPTFFDYTKTTELRREWHKARHWMWTDGTMPYKTPKAEMDSCYWCHRAVELEEAAD